MGVEMGWGARLVRGKMGWEVRWGGLGERWETGGKEEEQEKIREGIREAFAE